MRRIYLWLGSSVSFWRRVRGKCQIGIYNWTIEILLPYPFQFIIESQSEAKVFTINRKIKEINKPKHFNSEATNVIYTGYPRRKGQNFGRVFLMLKYTDITQNTYIQSWTVTEIMAREKCGLMAGLRTVPCQLTTYRMSVLDCRVRLQKYRWRSYVSTPLWLTMHVMYSAWNP